LKYQGINRRNGRESVKINVEFQEGGGDDQRQEQVQEGGDSGV